MELGRWRGCTSKLTPITWTRSRLRPPADTACLSCQLSRLFEEGAQAKIYSSGPYGTVDAPAYDRRLDMTHFCKRYNPAAQTRVAANEITAGNHLSPLFDAIAPLSMGFRRCQFFAAHSGGRVSRPPRQVPTPQQLKPRVDGRQQTRGAPSQLLNPVTLVHELPTQRRLAHQDSKTFVYKSKSCRLHAVRACRTAMNVRGTPK